jgi:hypothetical protein
MAGLKQTVLVGAATAGLLCMPITPAAAGPLLFVPWALGNAIGAAATLATLPLVVASAVASAQQPPAQYPPTSGYYGGPDSYAPPNYYARPPAYYAQPPGYYYGPQPYYRPALAYAPPMPHFYAPPRSYSSARTPYYGSYGAHVYPRSGGFADRRR